MKASDYVSQALHARGVRAVFEVIGGMTAHLVDSLHRDGRIRVVSMHHEQGAAFAAEGMARITGVPGVAMATSGPGATNLLTGVGSCFFDSSPAVFVTGQVNRAEQRGTRAIRQLGFQETDIVSMAGPVTKAAWRVERAEELPRMLDAAFVLATAGRAGPVLLDIPMDLQRADISDSAAARPSDEPRSDQTDPAAIEEMLEALRRAARPLILAGGGIRSGRVAEIFRRFVAAVRVPVVHSLMGVDLLPASDPLRVGMIGSYGNRWANLAVGDSDFLLVLGSRLDVRQTGSNPASFKGDRTVFHVDCEPGEMNNRVEGCRAIDSLLGPFLRAAAEAASQRPWPDRLEWREHIGKLRDTWPDIAEAAGVTGINPNSFFHRLSEVSSLCAAYVSDVGQHQMWAAQSLDLLSGQRFLTSGGMGAMGFGLPAAIGAAIAEPTRPIVLIAGDGGFQLNIQELQTVVRNRLPLKMVILNNGCLGMVRQFQQSYFDGRYASTLWGYSAPDFARVAEGYGLASHTILEPSGIPASLERLWRSPDEPFLLQVMIDTLSNAYPKMAFGRTFTDMEPQVEPVDMEGT